VSVFARYLLRVMCRRIILIYVQQKNHCKTCTVVLRYFVKVQNVERQNVEIQIVDMKM
jgi:hypothetical protein